MILPLRVACHSDLEAVLGSRGNLSRFGVGEVYVDDLSSGVVEGSNDMGVWSRFVALVLNFAHNLKLSVQVLRVCNVQDG